ncbi:MAG: DUF4965 domain-containing protein [Capsulimonadales bacterium]|nr:DUF4965 domain-containing protein [Capsulimonadales bacterium]
MNTSRRSGAAAALILACAVVSPAQTGSAPSSQPSRSGSKMTIPALPSLRLPAVPLIAHDPYFSVWSTANRLPDDWPRHWTGAVNALCGLIRIDNRPYRFSGGTDLAPALNQTSTVVLPTRTVCTFEQDGVRLTLTFLTPALPDDLDLLSRPVTYLRFETESIDGKPHTVSAYVDVTGEWVTDRPNQSVEWSRYRSDSLDILRIGASEQRPLNRSGDDLRIDWGHLYLAVPRTPETRTAMASDQTCRNMFVRQGELPSGDDLRMPRRASDGWPVLATLLPIGTVPPGRTDVRTVMLGYDDRLAIEYHRRPLPAYWKRAGKDVGDLLQEAWSRYETLRERSARFDAQLVADAEKAGGPRYAALCAASYRQCLAAHKLVADADGTPLYFSKENFSNGCIATVDVTYPSAPLFLLVNPTLLKGMLTPILDYARSPRWRFPFAPHDLGQYPLANGQVYGGGERTEQDQMPVEECGNMLILVSALTLLHNDADYLKKYYPTLTQWADYLMEHGYDPANQLCTDDFAGHLAHNTNLSLKAIVALGAFAKAAAQAGHPEAKKYGDAAAERAIRWTKDANDGDHFRLTFDGPGTWSQKYNLVWDSLLELHLFPAEVAKKELAFYRRQQKKYGLPLDNRRTYTKLDWILWSACLTGERSDFDALMDPVFVWMNETPSRVPLTDWYETTDGKQVGFQARSVVGGVFLRMLYDPTLREKYRKTSR